MHTELSLINRLSFNQSIVFLINDLNNLPSGFFSEEEVKIIDHQNKSLKKEVISLHHLNNSFFIQFIKEEENPFKKHENCRKAGDTLASMLNGLKIKQVVIHDNNCVPEEVLHFAEGLLLGNYQFIKYKRDKEKIHSLKEVLIFSKKIKKEQIHEVSLVTKAVTNCRSLINEPYSYLNAVVFSSEVEKMGKECGAKVEVMNKKKLESLKMGGLLAVNKASNEPPTFTVMEWKPLNAINSKPIIFVGKGIVYDSGGMNLKPGDSMANMKDDMSGAAAVVCAIYAIATAKIPVYVIGLMPATDNKIGPKAMMPGDIITMYNGTTVEVLNTDAEGRVVLADALSYAAKYKPELVIDLATLTGSAVRAIGKYGIVAMQVKAEKEFDLLKQSGWNVYERLVEFPAWEEYGELMKSDIADLKNLGPAEAGSITAGKFLENFTDYPYIHLDIAGPAFLEKRDSYRGQGGTGVGVRLLFDYIKRKIQ